MQWRIFLQEVGRRTRRPMCCLARHKLVLWLNLFLKIELVEHSAGVGVFCAPSSAPFTHRCNTLPEWQLQEKGRREEASCCSCRRQRRQQLPKTSTKTSEGVLAACLVCGFSRSDGPRCGWPGGPPFVSSILFYVLSDLC